MLAEDIMTRDPITARSTDTLLDALRTMATEGIRHLPVMEGRELVGMVSERDLRSTAISLALEGGRVHERLSTVVSAVMSSDVVTVAPDADLDEIIDLLLEHHIGAVPVVDPADGRLLGIVSYVDVLRGVRGRASQ